jgi:hypothetical protein
MLHHFMFHAPEEFSCGATLGMHCGELNLAQWSALLYMENSPVWHALFRVMKKLKLTRD